MKKKEKKKGKSKRKVRKKIKPLLKRRPSDFNENFSTEKHKDSQDKTSYKNMI